MEFIIPPINETFERVESSNIITMASQHPEKRVGSNSFHCDGIWHKGIKRNKLTRARNVA